MTPDPFADQMLAAPALIAYFVVKAWRPLAADVAVLLVAGTLLVVGGWLIDRGSARITAYRSAHSVDDAFDEIARRYDDDPGLPDEQAQPLPGVTHLGRPAPPPPGRPSRMPRIHGRSSRRPHSNSKRRTHS